MLASHRVRPAGNAALLVEAGEHQTLALARTIEALGIDGVIELVPGAATVLISHVPDPEVRARVLAALDGLAASTSAPPASREHRIEVRYDGADLDALCAALARSREWLVDWHTRAQHTVAFTGFAPGFAYILADPPLAIPRRPAPRSAIPAGAVALAGPYTGIYPRSSPGGWQLIGASDAALWDPAREQPALLLPGDRVTFVASPAAAIRLAVKATVAESAVAESAVAESAVETGAVATGAMAPPAVLGLRVDDPGGLALLQDEGRKGAAASGISRSGALDRGAYALANRMAGNRANSVAIELVGSFASFTATRDLVAALGGSRIEAAVLRRQGGRESLVEAGPFVLAAGDRLVLGEISGGMRSYLAVRGGFAVERTLGSAAHDVLAGIGPAPLRRGDTLALGDEQAGIVGDPQSWPQQAAECTEVPVRLGPRDDWCTPDGIATFFGSTWIVQAGSNRTGIRLAAADGDTVVDRRGGELPSEGCVPGSIQLPADGRPIIFLVDHPVTGGYPVIAVVDDAALDTLGQLAPGARLRFVEAR